MDMNSVKTSGLRSGGRRTKSTYNSDYVSCHLAWRPFVNRICDDRGRDRLHFRQDRLASGVGQFGEYRGAAIVHNSCHSF
jgi:hypothetical protein